MDSSMRTIIILLTVHSALSKETNAPVYEVINEQSRIDDNIRLSNSPVLLPYGNPLAGNSKQNARLHASNQQAMFNAERIRQHKAQLQRLNKGPQIIDSYMKAYHDLQENHQLEIEQQQATLKDTPVTIQTPTSARPRTRQRPQKRVTSNDEDKNERQPPKRVPAQRKELPRRANQRIDPVKASKSEALKDIRNRNHRSYGSSDYNQQLEPKRYQSVYISPVTSFDQGIAVKPNSNIGLKHPVKEASSLYTKITSSDANYQRLDHKFTSVQEIEALNSLLAKNPEQQLTEFTALLHPNKNEEANKDAPIDLYFYLKGPNNGQNIESPTGAYVNAYVPIIKDHTPITEQIEDIEDPNKEQPKHILETTEEPKIETATAKTNNYYKVEVASQTVAADKPYAHYGYDDHGDKSERYLHHNAQTTGLQHLLEDGTETSAFEDNLHYAANYEFGYRVHDQGSGNYYGHREAKKGENTKGQYHVLLPDGRMQQVKYSAGPEGFHADISYELQ